MPVIVENPISTFVRLENNFTNVSFTCKADGAVFYKWQRQHGSIPSSATGVNTSNLTIIKLRLKDVGYYRCIAINGSGSTESEYAALTLKGIIGDTYICIDVQWLVKLVCVQHVAIV